MKDKTKYYWQKLDKDFFNSYKVRSLMGQKNGDSVIVILLQLMNESLNYNGVLRYSQSRAYTIPELASVINRTPKQLADALKMLQEAELLRVEEDGTIVMEVNVGCETEKARRMREYRSNDAQMSKNVATENATSMPQCGTESRDKRLENRTEEDIKIKEIAGRLLELGYSSEFVDETLSILDKGLCPKTADMYRKIVNTMTDANIYNKEGYIYRIMENEVKA